MDLFRDVFHVETPSKRYPIYFAGGFSGLVRAFEEAGLAGRSAAVVSDSNVAPLYMGAVADACGGVLGQTCPFVFPAGEARKTLDTVRDMYAAFLAARLDRSSVVVALGGGVCGDMAGFAASTYMRGVPYVQIPTTLLAQVDSSVGGKTAVDFDGVKNAVGAFYQPSFVYTNIDTLKTLPQADFASGLGEVVKHGLIGGADYFALLDARRAGILAMDAAALTDAVVGSCRIKAAVVGQDEREGGLRETLNFGHTFGHAIETDSAFSIPHGQCVAIGMAAALTLSRAVGGLSEADAARALALIRAYGLQTAYRVDDKGAALARLLRLTLADKKTKNGRVTAVALGAIGAARSVGGVSERLLAEAFLSVLVCE